MSHVWMSHVTCMDESRQMSHVLQMSLQCMRDSKVMSHIWTSHATRMSRRLDEFAGHEGHTQFLLWIVFIVMQCVAVCCSVLQCVAVCCSVNLRGTRETRNFCYGSSSICCSVMQCVTVCCSVLQCVAECCRVLQCEFAGHAEHRQFL